MLSSRDACGELIITQFQYIKRQDHLYQDCWLEEVLASRDHCCERCLVSSIRRLKTQLLPHFFHSSPLMNMFDLGSPEEDDCDENIIQKEQAKCLL